MEVQIKGDQWNKSFKTVQVYWTFQVDAKEGGGMGGGRVWPQRPVDVKRGKSEYSCMSTAPNWNRIIEVSLVTYKLSFKFAETATM